MAHIKRHRRRPFKELLRAISYQKHTPLAMPLSQRFLALRHGFKSSAFALYDFRTNDPSDYLPDVSFREATNINGPFCRRILEDKLLFAELFKGHADIPAVVGVVERGKLYGVSSHKGERNGLSTLDALIEYCEGGDGVVLKPAAGWQGQGISSLEVRAGQPYLDGQASSRAEVERHLASRDNTLVTQRLVQDGYAAAIFQGSANSIRVTTMQDPDDAHRPFIPVVVHRFGSNTTLPTDNVSRGGLMANVDLDTGELGMAVKFPRETGGELFWCSHHPDTAARIKGVSVPEWGRLKAQLLGVAESFPFLRYVGWDVIVAQGKFWVVEANHNPSPAVQMFHPYLKDPKVRRFFSYHGVI